MGERTYREGITGAQLEWLKKDLSYVPKGSTVIISMHAAGWNKVDNEGNVVNAKALAEAVKDYHVHVFAYHTHFAQNNEVTPICMNTTLEQPVVLGGKAIATVVVHPTDI